jgi:hypothetical protein
VFLKPKQGKEATMPPYQTDPVLQSAALNELFEFVRAERVQESSFEEFEATLHEHVCALERDFLAGELARLDVQEQHISVDGKRFRRKGSHEQIYLTQAGELRVDRSLYVSCTGGGRAICPMELRAGIVGGYWSPRSAKIACTAVAQMTPRECFSVFEEQGGMQPSTSSLDRLPKITGERWEKKRQEFEETLRLEKPVNDVAKTLAISMDGVLTPMKGEGDQESPLDKESQGPAGYKEVGCATLSLLAENGDRLETIRYARMPQEGKKDVKAWVMREAQSILEADPDLEVVFVADGARDLWKFAAELEKQLEIPGMRKVLDAFHALERMKKAIDAAEGEGSAKAKWVFAELRERLCEEEDGVQSVLRALRYRRGRSKGQAKKVIATQVKYFEKNQDHMDYAAQLERCQPIGSGIVEAACKTLVTQRLKRSGMSWGLEGGQAVLTTRALIQSERWQSAWKLLSGEFIQHVELAA